MNEFYDQESLLQIALVTGVIGGGAAFLAGRAIALTWRPFWQLVLYMLPLGAAVRFVHFALFESTLLAPLSYAWRAGLAVNPRLPDGDAILLDL